MSGAVSKPLRWGILGTGAIARLFAAALPHNSGGTLAAVASRSSFDKDIPEFGDARRHHSYEALLNDDGVEAVYIATPHAVHAPWAIKAAEAGKHILCEKPIALNASETRRIVAAAESNGVLLMEAFMYRTHPQTAKLVELISGGAIGKVSLIQIEIGFGRPYDSAGRLYDPQLGGGAILDIGCYAMSMARLLAGAAIGRPSADIERISGTIKRAPNGVDEQAFALVDFPQGITAILSAPLSLVQTGGVRVHGDGGEIHVPSPWLCTGRTGGRSSISVAPRGKEKSEIVFETTDWLYALEAKAFADGVRAGELDALAAGPAESLGNMLALDEWRANVGVRFPGEHA